MKRSKFTLLLTLATIFLCGVYSISFAQGAGSKWEILNQEAVQLYNAGQYDRALVLAQKALQVAEHNVGPDHPDVATSLENLAGLYEATGRDAEAKALEERAAQIRAISR